MAIKKAASTKRATAKKPAAAKSKTNVRTVSAAVKSTPVARSPKASRLPSNIVNVVVAELVGTFVLTLVAMLALKDLGALYVGLTYVVLVLALSAVSGAHLNPAVTFGLWTMRRFKAVLVPFYWGAQLLGGMLAVIVTNWLTNGSVKLNFDHVLNFDWSIFGVELVATAVFLFGFAAVVSHRELTASNRAVGLGLSLLAGLMVGASLLAAVQGSFDTSKWAGVADVTHGYRVKAVTVNPAVALASSEATDGSFTGQRAAANDKQYSRLGLEVVVGTLVGAALGGNLYLLLVSGARRRE